MNYADVEAQQKEIFHRLLTVKDANVEYTNPTGILTTILEHKGEEAAYAMGDFGYRLRRFAGSINLIHPDLKNVYDGQLVGMEEGKFSRDAHDMLRLAAFGHSAGISQNVLDNLKRVIKQSEHYPTLNRVIDHPSDNQLHVRFLGEREHRDQARRSKRKQVIGLGTLYKKGAEFWNSHPSDFTSYYRYANRHQRDIDEAEERKRHFDQHGLTAMGAMIQQDIDELNRMSKSDQYLGFNKISLVSASIILGKMVGYEFGVAPSDVSCYGLQGGNVMAYARPDVFGEYDFFSGEFTNENHFGYNKLEYYPRAYTLAEVENQLPSEQLSRMVDYLETLPELGNYAAFDHYRVLVPGLNYPNCSTASGYNFKMPNGHTHFFETIDDAQEALDFAILRAKAAVGVLLGERDGDHYFISYWM